MASLESIRKRSGLVLGVVGLALVAFVLTDALSSASSMQPSDNTIGEINGEVIEIQDFERALKQSVLVKYGANTTDANNRQERKQLWDNMVKEAILNPEYEKLGLGVCSSERGDLMSDIDNGNMSPIARQLFGLQGETPDDVSNNSIKEQITNLLESRQAGVFAYWEEQIAKDRLVNKYNNLIKKGLYVTTTQAEDYFSQQGKTVNGRFVYKSYSSIPDTDISITDAEIQEYYNSNLDDYPQEEARTIDYVIFDIKASQEDKLKAKKRINELLEDRVVSNGGVYDTIPGFRNTNDPESFVKTNSDGPYNAAYLPKGKLSPVVLDEIMHTSPVGFVYGPYEDGGSFKIAKLLDVRSDSVQVAILEYGIIASNSTSNEIFAKAGEFALQNKTPEAFKAAVDADNSIKIQSKDVLANASSLPEYKEAREVVRWAFNENTAANDVRRFDSGDKYIVVMVTEKLPKGNQSLEKVKPQIEAVLKREKRKEMLSSEFESYLSSASDITALGTAAGLQVETVSGIPLASNNLTGVGVEPGVIGTFFSLDPQQISGPVAGNKGVFVVATDGFVVSSPSNDITAVQSQLSNSIQPRVGYELYNALKEEVEITDNRNKFY